MIPFIDFVAEYRGLSRAQFLKRVTVPHLAMTQAEREESASGVGFLTVKLTKDAVRSAKASSLSRQVLLPVKKRSGSNAFGMMITLGRAGNNDLVIPDTRISKFHAYFRHVQDRWLISDANSKNGTFVDGEPVSTTQGVELRGGAKIKVAATLELTFLTPAELYSKLQLYS